VVAGVGEIGVVVVVVLLALFGGGVVGVAALLDRVELLVQNVLSFFDRDAEVDEVSFS
jgi:hypothetical protein